MTILFVTEPDENNLPDLRSTARYRPRMRWVYKNRRRRMKQFFHSLAWYVKQLFPLTYRSHYGDHKGNEYFAVWRMWFGKVFKHECYDITGRENLAGKR